MGQSSIDPVRKSDANIQKLVYTQKFYHQSCTQILEYWINFNRNCVLSNQISIFVQKSVTNERRSGQNYG